MPAAVIEFPRESIQSDETLADLVERLGGVPLSRIRMHPAPGSATPADVTRLQERRGILCELIDGVLVEKPVGYVEARLAMRLGRRLDAFAEDHNLGPVTGADGTMEVIPGQVRIPDVAFVSWNRHPDGRLPLDKIPRVAPNLAVEVLSEPNTPAEMARKRRECFEGGTQLFWEIAPPSRSVRVYTGPETFTTLTGDDMLDGGTVLPGFRLSLRELFAELDRPK